MFQLRGMPFVDLAFLHKSDLKGNTLSYRRHKTGGQMIVDIPPTAMELIRQYQNTDCNSPYLFPILERHQNRRRAVYRVSAGATDHEL